ncbi:MAG TPA: MFS transporter [Pseudonocardiaceae bacterium]|nr:MFS transporter [Pseudonocardiaceae bacterium]
MLTRPLRLARASTFVFFALNGFLLSTWVVHIPAIEDRTGITHARLGWLLLLMGGGAVVALQASGRLVDRFGSRRIVPAAGLFLAAAVIGPALATNAWTLTVALILLGVGNGALDVAMNAHAVQVERGYARPVMSAFHAVFSVGGVLASLAGAQAIARGWDLRLTLGCSAAFGAMTTLIAGTYLLQRERVPCRYEAVPTRKRRMPSHAWMLGVPAFLLMLTEGVANDWSTLDLKDVLGAPPATAALAYGAFSTAMTTGRLLTDLVAARKGAIFIIHYGTAVAAVGLTTVALSPWVPIALLGWTVFGIGLSGCVPQFFTAAGNVDRSFSGMNLSRVVGMGYLGLLAGPALIGILTHVVPLNMAFFLPVGCCIAAGISARVLKTAPSQQSVSTHSEDHPDLNPPWAS